MAVPVVDFKGVFFSPDVSNCPQVKEIHSAFTTVGFVFITNHGIRRPFCLSWLLPLALIAAAIILIS